MHFFDLRAVDFLRRVTNLTSCPCLKLLELPDAGLNEQGSISLTRTLHMVVMPSTSLCSNTECLSIMHGNGKVVTLVGHGSADFKHPVALQTYSGRTGPGLASRKLSSLKADLAWFAFQTCHHTLPANRRAGCRSFGFAFQLVVFDRG